MRQSAVKENAGGIGKQPVTGTMNSAGHVRRTAGSVDGSIVVTVFIGGGR
ncbi:MAG: hypothetical protein WCT99_09440 [Bacteroidota bacterium]